MVGTLQMLASEVLSSGKVLYEYNKDGGQHEDWGCTVGTRSGPDKKRAGG